MDFSPLFSVGDLWSSSSTDSGTICNFTQPPDNLQTPWTEQKSVCYDELDLNIPDSLYDELLQDILPTPTFPGKLESSELPQDSSSGVFFQPLEQNVGEDLTLDFLTPGENGGVPIGNDIKIQVPSPSRGKVGCKAMGYIGAHAVLETHGTPAPPRQALDCNSTNGTKLCGALPINTKLAAVPQQVNSSITVPSNSCVTSTTDPKLTPVPDQIISTVTIPPNPCGTLTIDPKLTPVPEKVTYIVVPPELCGTPSTNPQEIVGSVEATSILDANSEVTCAPKKRRRRRRQKEGEDGEARKARLYEIGPLDDAKEERKRKDAIRARKSREKKSNEVKELQEKVASMERELQGRRMYEDTLRMMLREKANIVVLPYGTPPREHHTAAL